MQEKPECDYEEWPDCCIPLAGICEMQDLRFRTLTQQGFEIWPSTQHDFSAAGHQFFALQTTLKPSLDKALTQPNEKPRVSAICRVAWKEVVQKCKTTHKSFPMQKK